MLSKSRPNRTSLWIIFFSLEVIFMFGVSWKLMFFRSLWQTCAYFCRTPWRLRIAWGTLWAQGFILGTARQMDRASALTTYWIAAVTRTLLAISMVSLSLWSLDKWLGTAFSVSSRSGVWSLWILHTLQFLCQHRPSWKHMGCQEAKSAPVIGGWKSSLYNPINPIKAKEAPEPTESDSALCLALCSCHVQDYMPYNHKFLRSNFEGILYKSVCLFSCFLAKSSSALWVIVFFSNPVCPAKTYINEILDDKKKNNNTEHWSFDACVLIVNSTVWDCEVVMRTAEVNDFSFTFQEWKSRSSC